MKNPKPHGYDVQPKKFYPECPPESSESQSVAGTSIFVALDEKDALANMVQSVPVVYGDSLQSIHGGDEDF